MLRLFFGSRKNLGSDTKIDTVVKLVVPNLTRGTRFSLDAFLAGLVIGQRLGTGGDTAFANAGHLIDGFVVFVSLQ